MDTPPASEADIHSTIGVVFFGFTVSVVLYGITVLQAYQYFMNSLNDSKKRKASLLTHRFWSKAIGVCYYLQKIWKYITRNAMFSTRFVRAVQISANPHFKLAVIFMGSLAVGELWFFLSPVGIDNMQTSLSALLLDLNYLIDTSLISRVGSGRTDGVVSRIIRYFVGSGVVTRHVLLKFILYARICQFIPCHELVASPLNYGLGISKLNVRVFVVKERGTREVDAILYRNDAEKVYFYYEQGEGRPVDGGQSSQQNWRSWQSLKLDLGLMNDGPDGIKSKDILFWTPEDEDKHYQRSSDPV
ncbi:hypothetical protein BDQ12DRAFT_756295 [Crucibulum laeve]|uniref:Uncharacterized protein n=1 Tax=Crucibulum laeve TaxID=68775 RepID=A0A5C3LW08_9AGAR|nr:hypothetical protein BDQ12DRAFT_756295 [Crucibulum laeve]